MDFREALAEQTKRRTASLPAAVIRLMERLKAAFAEQQAEGLYPVAAAVIYLSPPGDQANLGQTFTRVKLYNIYGADLDSQVHWCEDVGNQYLALARQLRGKRGTNGHAPSLPHPPLTPLEQRGYDLRVQ